MSKDFADYVAHIINDDSDAVKLKDFLNSVEKLEQKKRKVEKKLSDIDRVKEITISFERTQTEYDNHGVSMASNEYSDHINSTYDCFVEMKEVYIKYLKAELGEINTKLDVYYLKLNKIVGLL